MRSSTRSRCLRSVARRLRILLAIARSAGRGGNGDDNDDGKDKGNPMGVGVVMSRSDPGPVD